MKHGLLTLTFISVIVLGGLHQIGSLFYLYWNFDWFDTCVHFIGGFSVALIFIWFWYRRKVLPLRRSVIVRTLIFVAAVSVAWEIFEYHFDIALPAGGNYLVDTATDLLADILGGLVGGFIGTMKKFHA